MPPVSNFIHEAFTFLTEAPIQLQIVAGAIGFFLFLFALLFFIPGLWLWMQLFRASQRLGSIKREGGGDPTRAFSNNRTLAHLWAEYKDTLHEQRAFDPATGTLAPVVLRATPG